MKSYLMPRSNQPYECHWCRAILPRRSAYVMFIRYGERLKMHVACTKQLVRTGWLYELDLSKINKTFPRSYLDHTSDDSAWQEYIDGELTQHDTPTIR